jgi:hypothetical protein
MKQYDHIYVPSESGFDTKVSNLEWDVISEQKNVIVLTVQDLQDLWNAAQDRANALQIGDPGDTKIFEAYLESKGLIYE